MTNYIALNDLEHGRVYRIHSRNLTVGVWNSVAQGFIGIRRKFNSYFLFTELEYTVNDYFGTARAVEALDTVVPSSMQISESLDPVCRECGDRTFQVWKSEPSWPNGQRCVGNKHYVNSGCHLEGTHCSVIPENRELYNLMHNVQVKLGNPAVILVNTTTVEN